MSRTLRMRAGRVFLIRALALSCSAVLLAAAPPALQAPHSDEASPERETWYLVRHRCFLCHNIDQPGTKFAPSLRGFFEREDARLINGKPVNDQTVSELIAEGTSNMPAFKAHVECKADPSDFAVPQGRLSERAEPGWSIRAGAAEVVREIRRFRIPDVWNFWEFGVY